MKTYKIAAIPGDGIGTEVISAGVTVLEALAGRAGDITFDFDHFDWGGDYYKKHGRMMPVDGREQIRHHDAILFGSAGHPDIPDHITLWGLINTPMCGQRGFCLVSPRRCAMSPVPSSIG
jgi:tartrate dehydrogenase/decarboxylase/D-malate dehydrogenase